MMLPNLLLGLVLPVSAFQEAQLPPGGAAPAGLVLDDAALPRWRAHLRPDAHELAWEAIPWIPELAPALARADREGRPLLLWAMNGHPLGCT